MGLAWASGINLYATLFTLGYLANTGNIDLPPDLQIVANPMVMAAAGLMYCIEFLPIKRRASIPAGMRYTHLSASRLAPCLLPERLAI